MTACMSSTTGVPSRSVVFAEDWLLDWAGVRRDSIYSSRPASISESSGQQDAFRSAVINGQATEVIDVGHFRRWRFADCVSQGDAASALAAIGAAGRRLGVLPPHAWRGVSRPRAIGCGRPPPRRQS